MELINKAKELNEKTFIIKAENGYLLYANYTYRKNNEKILLYYKMQRQGNKYVLEIDEGIEDADFGWGFESERSAKIEFLSVEKALNYLKEKESFRIEDWSFSAEGKKDFEKTRKMPGSTVR